MYSHLLVEEIGRTTVVKLNRPDFRNSLTGEVIRELALCFESLGRNAGCRAVLLTGEGSSFCAGMDIEYLRKSTEKDFTANEQDARALLGALQAIRNCPKPVIALVNGPAMGGGCGIAAACDYVFAAAETAKFGVPEVRLGFVPAVILFFLYNRIGAGKTRQLVLQGAILNAADAKEAGLATGVTPSQNLKAFGVEFAESLAASTSGSSVAATKELLNRFDAAQSEKILEYAIQLNASTRATDDFKRGVEAFLKKEKITW
jgi:methylglutaconyl-CoA hydratase